MEKYDPHTEPEAEEWLGLDEQERILLVVEHQERARESLPNVRIHSTIHVIVENQVALGDEVPAAATWTSFGALRAVTFGRLG